MSKHFLETISDQSICRIETTFVDGIGNVKIEGGTAFWIKHNNDNVLVTNRHVFDLRMKSAENKEYRIIRIRVLAREKKDNVFTSRTEFFEVDLGKINGFVHRSADVAVLVNPCLKASVFGNFNYSPIEFSDLADKNFFQDSTQFLDSIAFIGYPKNWVDTTWNSPIARIANISCNPKRPFNNELCKSTDMIQVTGLAFGGSSGSPVVFLEKGIAGITTNEFLHIPPKIIGIMSAGLLLSNRGAHSGLSYFTRSTSIIEVLSGKNSETIIGYIADLALIKKYSEACKH